METTHNTSEDNNMENQPSSNLSIVIIAALAVISILIGGFFVFKNKSTTDKTNTDNTTQMNPQQQLQAATAVAEKSPTIPNLINLGLAYFNNGMYAEAVIVNTQVLQADSTNAIAYNNICAAYNNLYRYEEAIYFGNMALQYDASNDLAKNNIDFAKKRIEKLNALQKKMNEMPDKETFIELGIFHYKRKEFKQAINIYERGLQMIGDDALLYNNLCAAYCELKQWEKAIGYCNKSLALQADFNLAKNNLKWANDGKAGKYN